MRLILKKDIIEIIIDAIAEAETNNDSVEMIYLDKDEYDRYKTSCAKAPFSTGPGYVCGVEIRQVPEYDLFHNGDYWIKHSYDIGQGPFMVYDGQAYRKVSNLAGEPAPIKTKADETRFETKSDGISFNSFPDESLIDRLYREFVKKTAKGLNVSEADDLINGQHCRILNLEAKLSRSIEVG